MSLAEVNSQVGEIITDKNQVFIMYGPDKDGFVVPSESEIESTVLAAQQKRYDAYQEEQVPATLMAVLPAPGKIVSEKPYGKFGVTEIVLSNGMKVYVKSTDYQADQITMSMRGEGGTSVYGDEDIPNFAFLSGSITEAGVGDFTYTFMPLLKTISVMPNLQYGFSDTILTGAGKTAIKVAGTCSSW